MPETVSPPPATAPDAPVAPVPVLAAPPEATALLDERKVHFAIAHPTRRAVLRTLAGGEVLSVQLLAGRLKVPQTLMGKHCRILRNARLINEVPAPDGDGRKTFFLLPAPFRTRDTNGRTVLDFNSVALRL